MVNRLGRQCSDVPECSLASQNQILKTAVIRECVDNPQKVQKVAPECLFFCGYYAAGAVTGLGARELLPARGPEVPFVEL
jgi:hypothetical protein